MKCKLKDMCDDLIELGLTKISFNVTGVGLMLADVLKEKGVEVEELR